MGQSEVWKQVFSSLILLRYFCVLLHPSTKQNNKILVQMFRCTVALWKSWVCKYSIIFQVIKLKILCETLKNEKWKILAWYPNKMRQYHQRNPKCGHWCWMNFQMQVALVQARCDTLLQIRFFDFSGILPYSQTTYSTVKACNLKDCKPDVQSQQSLWFNVVIGKNKKFK